MEQRQTTSFFRFTYPLAGIMEVGKRGLPTQYSFPSETGHPFQAAEQSMAMAHEVGLAEDGRAQIVLADTGNALVRGTQNLTQTDAAHLSC